MKNDFACQGFLICYNISIIFYRSFKKGGVLDEKSCECSGN